MIVRLDVHVLNYEMLSVSIIKLNIPVSGEECVYEVLQFLLYDYPLFDESLLIGQLL